MSNQPPAKRYYPRISSVISENDIPDILGFIKTGIVNLLDNIYFKDLQYDKSPKGDSAFYSLSVVSPRRIDIEIPGTGIFLVLNPDIEDNNISAFPVTIEYQWKILAYLRSFSIGNFSFDPQQIFEVALRVLNISEEQAIAHFINVYVKPINDSISSVQQFVNDLNKINPDWNLPAPTEQTQLTDVVTQIYSRSGRYASLVAFSAYLISSDLQDTASKVKNFFQSFIPQDIDEYIKDIVIPKFRATLLLSAGIEFPRNILVPVDRVTLEPVENKKVTLTFAEALFYADTEKGFGYNMDLVLSTNSPAQIGNTGLIVDINNLKIDLSKTENIAEADADGRPKDFMGVYIEYAEIFLPKKWFKKNPGRTIGISANNLLVGTGGVSGNITIAATYKTKIENGVTKVESYFREYFNIDYSNFNVFSFADSIPVKIKNHDELIMFINNLRSPSDLKFQFPITVTPIGKEPKKINTEREYLNFLKNLPPVFNGSDFESRFLWFKLGDHTKYQDNPENDKKFWSLGFQKFSIDFHHGKVVHSSLHAALKIEKFKKLNGDGQLSTLYVDIAGEWENSENFKLSAGFLPDGKKIQLYDNVILTLQSAELGKKDNNFFIGADTKISFPANSIMGKLVKSTEIDLPAIRIYSNGRFEITGGIGFIPVNFTLPLGPVKMSVSGLHLGSIQRERDDVMRNYNYIGFDGGLSIDPIGVDIKGNGVKYYYTTDDDDFGGDGDNYLHISTLEIDLIIPGTASETDAIAVIRGSLTLPDPGYSEEYGGSVMIKLPKAKIAGEAAMRLNPKNKSFLVKAAVEFPSPIIPLGPVGIYGFAGLIGKKYVADKKVVFPTNADQKTWYDYYMAPQQGVGVDKFRDPTQTSDYTNPFSIGIGASLGTMADGGRTMSLRAMFLLSMPSMFAIDAGLSILSDRLMLTDKRIPPFYAFLIIGDDSLEFGAGANYQLNKTNGWFIDIKAEVQMGFFFKNQRPWYINFGTKEKPITATLFKDILNIKAESFLMISAAGIEAGAKVAFDFDLIIARAWVMVEVGTKVSFERPQIGGYIYIEGGFSLDFAIVKVSLAVSIFFSVELVKPFLIFAQLRVQFNLKIGWKWFSIKIKFHVLLTFKWEKNKKVDLDAIAPLTFEPVLDADYPKQVTTDKNVKGIHMLTNESFDLKYLKTMPSTSISIEDEYIIPLDTFIDIKMEKGLAPSQLVDDVIGSHTGMANNYIELIPPNETTRGRLTLRQVKHKYSIEEISIKIAAGRNWVEYKPYEVLFPNEKAGNNNDTSTLKIGHWQRNSDRYDIIRLLATSPFTFMDSGEPGWVNPEQFGITPSSLFCVQKEAQWHFSNFLNIPLGTEYKPPIGYNAYMISGAYYNIDGTYSQTLEIDENGNTIQVISDDKMVVRNTPNPFDYDQSLEFSNGDNLVITFPESAVKIKLKLTTYSTGVKIKCYKKVSSDPSKPDYKLIDSFMYTKAELVNIIEIGNPEYTSEGEAPPVFSMIKIVPKTNEKDRIEEIIQEIAAIWAEAVANAGEGASSIILTRLQQANLTRLEDELRTLKNKACSEVTCKNLNFNVLANNTDGLLDTSFTKIINTQVELSDIISQVSEQQPIPIIDFENYSVIILYRAYPIIHPKVGKIIKTTSSIKIQLIDTGVVYRPTGAPYLIIKTEKIKELPIIITEDDCYCSDNPCNRQDVLCDYFDNLKDIMANCVDYSKPFVENIDCFNNFYTLISDFDHRYPQYAIGDSFDFPDEWDYDPSNPPSIDEALKEAYAIIAMIKREKGDCGCTGSDGGVTETICTTALQELQWQTLTEYEYQQTIPEQDAVIENANATMDAFSKTLQPIWRPNSKFLLHFRLKDEVVYNENSDSSKTFDYYYGFKTMGPVGHFHKQKPEYLKYKNEKGEDKTYKPEEKAITSLRAYLDFNRSYPNPDGNLIGSKPLFYGHDQCRIDLFFDKPYVSHMFSDWPNFKGLLDLIKMDMPIAIKDPVSEAIIPYPLPEDWREEDVPGADYKWIDDKDPNLPLGIKTFLNYWQSTNTNPENTRCHIKLGDAIVPNVKMRSAILTNLMPEKLYTAIVYSSYDANGDGKIENQMDDNIPLKIKYQESQPIHEFGFITSRYANFREQVESYLINEVDSKGQITESKQSVYNLFVDLTTLQINNLYSLIIRKPNAETELLRNQYIHEFDRSWEGVLKMSPLQPASRTEFIKIMNNSLKNEVIAILIRNPEPFNDPRIPIEYIYDRINEKGFLEDGILKVLGSKGAGLKYKILWSKDFSQALIMHENKKITAQELQFQFIYKTWDGNQRKYAVKNEDGIDQDVKLNTVITEPISIN